MAIIQARLRVSSMVIAAIATLLLSAIVHAQAQPDSRPSAPASATAPATSPKANINPFDPESLKHNSAPDFNNMSIEDLMNIEVISTSSNKQRLSDLAAAFSVRTFEDLF